MSVLSVPVTTIDGRSTTLGDLGAKALLVVNVASKCGLTKQYATLQELQEKYRDQGLVVTGFPCNQFNGQEPGTNAEIQEFCSSTYGVDFPLFDKIEVNGPGRHPLYDALTAVEDAEGIAGDIQWNFEKFVVGADGSIARFRPRTEPDAPEVIAAIIELIA
ncbi:MAG TPA: glutathione peroxidase [Actinobacteria bacterium]|nr:glutathione peroxidase [Actinomycetota bacterium]